jgi:hypothetical protein
MKYKFEYGSKDQLGVAVEVEVDEKELISLLLRDVYGMNIHMHREYIWLYVELYRKNEILENKYVLTIQVEDLKEIYQFLVVFVNQPNVVVCSDYWFKEDYKNSKLELVERCVRKKDNLHELNELIGVEGIKLFEDGKESRKTSQKPKENKQTKGIKVDEDCPY